MLSKEGRLSDIQDTTEFLPQVTVHTEAPVPVGVESVSILTDGRDQSLIPGLRETAGRQDEVEEFEQALLQV